jgi:sugar lactone lactonase YvrE
MKTNLTTFALLVLALLPSRVKGDNLFVEAGGIILRFDTTVGAASESTFVSVNGGADSLAVDASGNVYAGNINYPYGSIYKFAPNGSGDQFAVPLFSYGLTLDTNGNLFMDGDTYPGRTAVIYKFTPATNQSIFASGSGLSVGGLAFDRNGILWMANGGYGTVIKFVTGGNHSTFVTLPGSSSYPRCVAFDSQGDLFVSDYGANIVYEFTNNAGNLSSSVNTFASVGEPYGLAFDSSGDLFVASESSGNIYEYINAGGSLSPTPTTFASGLSDPTALAIGAVAPSLNISYSTGNVVVSWPSPSTGFVLQTNGVISTVNWSNYSGTVTTNGTTNSVTISPPSGHDFFRLAKP